MLAATNFLTKGAQILGDCFGHFEDRHLKVKVLWLRFGHLLKTLGELFILAPGHTGSHKKETL